MNITTLVVDDEPLARRRLAALLADVPWALPLGEAHDGTEAIAAAERLRPQVVFLDVQMPECSGVEVAKYLRARDPAPAVIFTTAYDEYAITAFELGAVDYLLKPFGERRFREALDRARARAEAQDGAAALDRALARFGTAAPARLSPHDPIFVREGNSVLPLSLAAIERIEANDDYALIHTGQRRHLVSLRLHALEQRLPNPPFLRVHRSHIVSLDHVERMVGLDDSRLEVHMKSGAVIPVSRARSQDIRRRSR